MGTVTILGKRIHTWLLVTLLVTVGVGAGAAPAIGKLVEANIPLAVSQALVVGKPVLKTPVDSWLSSVSDDGTGFTAAATVNTGDWYVFMLPLGNNSKVDLIAELAMSIPMGLGVSVQEKAGSYVRNVVRTGPATWQFDVKAEANLGTEAVHPALLVKIEALEERLNVLKGLSGTDYDLLLTDIKMGLWALGAELDWFGLTDLLAIAEAVMEKALALGSLTPGSPEALAMIDSMLLDLGVMKADLPPGISGIEILVKVQDNVLGYGNVKGLIRQISH